MLATVPFGRPLVIICAATMFGCGGDRQPLSPSSPSAVAASSVNRSVRPSDYHEPGPTPDPAPVPPPVVPGTLTISIVDTAGPAAFLPNPIAAAIGDLVVWTNNDSRAHHIVLDNGADVGIVAPGQSTAAIAIPAVTAGYRCTIHPSMVGMIHDPSVPPPAPAPPPYEPPPYEPPPDPYY